MYMFQLKSPRERGSRKKCHFMHFTELWLILIFQMGVSGGILIFRAWQINQINLINHTNQINHGSIDLCKLGGRSIGINQDQSGSITKTKGPIDPIDPIDPD